MVALSRLRLPTHPPLLPHARPPPSRMPARPPSRMPAPPPIDLIRDIVGTEKNRLKNQQHSSSL